MYVKTNIIYLMHKKNITYYALEKETKISRTDISKLVKGQRNVKNLTIETIVRLANFFNVSLDDFVLKDLSLTEQE